MACYILETYNLFSYSHLVWLHFLTLRSLSGRASSHLEYAQMLVIDQVDLIDLPIVGPLQAYADALLGACIAALHWRVLMEGLRLN